MTYPESDNVAVVNVLPPSLLIEAIMSVFIVTVSLGSSSWNTTILLVVGTVEVEKAFDTNVVEPPGAGVTPVPVMRT